MSQHAGAVGEGEEVVEDYVSMRLTLRAHPMALIRPHLTPPPPERTLERTLEIPPEIPRLPARKGLESTEARKTA